MWSGREVRFWAILFFCVAALHGRAGASGTEEGAGLSVRLSGCPCLLSFSSLCSLGYACSLGCPSSGCSIVLSYPSILSHRMVAMSLPDGPGAVCLGVLGFVCVSLVKNRRLWIGLCVFVLSNGRLGAARLSRMGAAAPELAGPDFPRESGSDHVLWHQLPCRVPDRSADWPAARPSVPEVLALGPRAQRLFLGRLRDDRSEGGLLSRPDQASDGSCVTRLPHVGWGILRWSVSCGCIELARPPPRKDPQKTG
jgi:hypothetical protein